MTFIFKEFVSKVIGNFIESMTASCCAPSPDEFDLEVEDSQDAQMRDIAKRMTVDFGEYSPDVLTPNGDDFELKESNYSYSQQLISDQEYRDLLLISGYIHELERDIDLKSGHGVGPILDLCLNFYFIHDRNGINLVYLLAEQCEHDIFPSLESDDEEYDDDELHDGGYHQSIQSYREQSRSTRSELTQSTFLENISSTYGGIYISEIGTTPKKYYCNIYELQDEHDTDNFVDKLSIFQDEWIIKFAGLSTTKDIILPTSIHKRVTHQYRSKQDTLHQLYGEYNTNRYKYNNLCCYNVIFKVGGSGKAGWSDSCSAIIVDETSLNHHKPSTGLFGFNWHLPSLPTRTGGNGLCFDNQHGLISCGGYKSSSCYILPFEGEDYFDQNYNWVWKQLPDMNEIRWFPSCTFVGSSQENQRLISMCGSSADHEPLCSMEVYDFESKQWSYLSSCNKARKYGGLSCIDNRLYLGGGDHATQCVEYYDFDRNKWYNLPSTQLPHRYYPNLWMDANQNILYISCSYSNSIEALDLRSNESSWNVLCGAKLFKTDSLDLDYNQFRSVL